MLIVKFTNQALTCLIIKCTEGIGKTFHFQKKALVSFSTKLTKSLSLAT